MGHLELYHLSVFIIVLICWFVFAVIFFSRKRPPQSTESKRDNASLIGFMLQAIGFAFIWGMRRQLFTHIFEVPPLVVEIFLAALAVVLAITSVFFVRSAINALGAHWSVGARTVKDHKLITDGPYSVVRHPIYSGLFGMLIATGLSFSQWEGFVIGIPLYLIGTLLRIRSEERLLREALGEEFENYTRRVPSFIPFLHF